MNIDYKKLFIRLSYLLNTSRTSEAPFSFNGEKSTQETNTTLSSSTRSETSFNVIAAVLPIILVIAVLVGIVVAVLGYRKRCRGNRKKAIQQETEKNEDVEQEETLLCGKNDGLKDVHNFTANLKNDEPETFTREELLSYMNIKLSEIAQETNLENQFAFALREIKSLALVGKWGSGKRTLAVQIALELEHMVDEKFQFKVIRHFDETYESSISRISQPTVIILPDLYKFWFTDQHSQDVIKSLTRIRSKKTNLHIIATFTENDMETFSNNFPDKKPNYLFRRIMRIHSSSKTLSDIGRKHQRELKEVEIDKIMTVRSVLGMPLITSLFCKHALYRNPQFFNLPLIFILSDLRRMRDSSDERLKFRVLEYKMLHGGEVDKEKLENDIDHPLFDEISDVDDKRGHIKGYVTQLLNGYIEETQKSYRILHDVITKCVFLVAAEKEQELLFMECDCYLLFDCIRMKSRMEKIRESGRFSFDYDSLSMGIPTESFSMVVKIFKKRNDIMPMLRKVKLFDDIVFQQAWNTIESQ